MKKIIFGLFTLVILFSCSKSDSNDKPSGDASSSLYYWKGSIEYDNTGYDGSGIVHNQVLKIYPDWKSQLPTEMYGDALFDNKPNGAQLFFDTRCESRFLFRKWKSI